MSLMRGLAKGPPGHGYGNNHHTFKHNNKYVERKFLLTTSPCKAWITSVKIRESGMIPRNCFNLLHIYIPPAPHVFVFFPVRILHDFRHKLLTNCSHLGNRLLIISGYTLYCKQLMLIRLFFIILGQWDISLVSSFIRAISPYGPKGYLYFITTFLIL